MPTDIEIAITRRAEAQAPVGLDLVLLLPVALCLANLVLALVSPAVANAVSLVGRY